MSRPPGWKEKGSALTVVIIVAALLMATALAAFSVAQVARRAALRRLAQLRAERLAHDALLAAAGWFEAAERGSLTAPPGLAAIDRERRVVDPEGDGTYVTFRRAAAPWNVRYKEGGGSADLFRPPERNLPAQRFVGNADGPDLCLVAAGAARAELLDLSHHLDPSARSRIAQICFFGPIGSADPQALATIEVQTTALLPSGPPARAVRRATIVAVDWGRLDRPLEIADRATLIGNVSWRFGEARVDGDLIADATTVALWPGGIPWLALNQPLRDDTDRDGSDDDADGDGRADLQLWRDLPGSIPDPWWRARLGGRLSSAAVPPPCSSPFPFGPRAVPPVAPGKSSDRSGLFCGCPLEPIAPQLAPPFDQVLAARGRGVRIAIESESRSGCFQLDGRGRCRTIDDLWDPRGGAGIVIAATNRRTPLAWDVAGQRGVLFVRGAPLVLGQRASARIAVAAPSDPRDTAGQSRAARADDPYAPLDLDGGPCAGWQLGRWLAPGGSPAAALDWPCGVTDRGFEGSIVVDGTVNLRGPLTLSGTLRGRELTADGSVGPIVLEAVPVLDDSRLHRPTPPGAPAILIVEERAVPF